ncbi:unnamed protein product [Soboliphyme baturini]|uniref:ATP-dependent RNA helicase DHX34 n=1 Tax=Soboliphyme baturini TaxID=241478 RepID=A0A183IYB5_9BILA|nr:unnamed protein product [Soboliphyme baturini]
MDIKWLDYRSALKRIYFSDRSLIPLETDDFQDFWKFFDKYLDVARRKSIRSEPVASGRPSFGGALTSSRYSRYYRQLYVPVLDKTERYAARSLPTNVVAEFEYVLNCYVEFRQRKSLGKLKAIQRAQRNLPIYLFKGDIVRLVRSEQVVIIAGDTGCGKSTQTIQYLLGAGFDRIACTQPRRIACISLCKRVAYETLNVYGSSVAYQIRFERTKTASTKGLFLTEGLLLRQLSIDPDLSAYDVVIMDEIHERHLQGDFLLGVLRDLVLKRRELKLVLMSATINLELFSGYFERAPILQVPGRLYPIKLVYMPLPAKESKSERIDPSPYRGILSMIDQKYPASERGDVLIFLSGITEITTVAEALKEYADLSETRRWVILMLHSTLSLDDQDRVFDITPDGVRKCILSTNIAETSVTIDGVRFVVDSGKVKEMRYDADTKMHTLKECWISQASAEQRKGRAGRTGPGNCYRFYSPQQYEKFDKYTEPEIRRVSLSSLLLQMYHLNIADPRNFRFIEPPNKDSIENAITHLKDQSALTNEELLSPLGQILVNLPVDVRIGKMLVMGCLFQQIQPILTVAAALDVQSPFTSRSFRDLEAQSLRGQLMSDSGDPFALLNVYREWLNVKAQNRESSTRWCRKRGIEEQRLYEISKLRSQFKGILEDSDLIEHKELHLSAAQRRIRKGEVLRLKSLKRKFQSSQRSRKVLKLKHWDDELEPDAAEEGNTTSTADELKDVRAVDFYITHTSSEIEANINELAMDDLSLCVMKSIVCGALYPQYGVLDVHNSYKPGSDLVIHSKAKSFLLLHPNGCLAQDAESLCVLQDGEGRSGRHHLIFYSLLLETTKPYAVNTVRAPALHSLLLFARHIDTSADFHRIVCDQFVEFQIVIRNPKSEHVDTKTEAESGQDPSGPGSGSGSGTDSIEDLVFEAVQIRQRFAQCLERKLAGDKYRSQSLPKRIHRFFRHELLYSLRHLLPADVKSLYGCSDSAAGGRDKATAVTDYLTVGSLAKVGQVEDAASYLTKKWRCDNCGNEFYFSFVQRLEHQNGCVEKGKGSGGGGGDASDDEHSSAKSSANTAQHNDYYCSECCICFDSPINYLKHKRLH